MINVADVLVVGLAAVALAGLGWIFFGPRRATATVLAGGVQRLEVTVRGGYRPEVIRVRQGVPVELTFDRQESGDCTSRVVFPDFRASATLPAYQRTTVRLDPGETGEFGFACGMNMIRGTLIVEPAAGGPADRAGDEPASVPGSPAEPAGDAEEAERALEIADLARRVLAGVAGTVAPFGRYEQPDHDRHRRRLRVQPAGHRRARPAPGRSP